MRRLIVTGIPCPPESWETFFGSHPNQRIIPIWEVFANTTSSDPRVMSKYVTEQIEKFQPESIICHDFGVPLTLLSLLRLKRQGRYPKARITLFNGAFRKFDIFKANHPLRLQYTPVKKVIREVELKGGTVDPRLKAYLPRIRAMYRFVILFGLTEKLSHFFGLEDLIGPKSKPSIRASIQIIASPNDPYIPFEAIEQLERDFPAERFIRMEYGHFPYSVNPHQILPLIQEFENHA